LDGKCERMKEPIRGSSKLNISQEFWELPYVKGIRTEIRNDLLVPKSHFDAVTKAPKDATIYA